MARTSPNGMLCVIFSANKITTDCANRMYVFERIPGYKMEGSATSSSSGSSVTVEKEIMAENRTDCEDACLNEFSFPCRSASYDRASKKCRLSKETRYMNPKNFKSDPNADYMENLCLPSKSTRGDRLIHRH